MTLQKNIDELLLFLSDPRNISPQDFATFYPLEDKTANPNNLSFLEIENHFSSLQKFKVSENWGGYISLTSKIYLIYESFNKLSNEDKSIFINYFALIIKDASFKTQSFVNDKILSKKEYYNLLGIYQIFFNNLLFDILSKLKNLVNTSLVGTVAAQSKEDKIRKEQKYIVGMLFAKDELNKYFKVTTSGGLAKVATLGYEKIANELGFNDNTEIKGGSIRVLLNAMVSNSEKSVLNDLDVMQLIINDCKKQKIEVHSYFLKRFEDLKAKTS